MANIRDKQSDPKDREPTSKNPSAGSSNRRPTDGVPPTPKFGLRGEPPAGTKTPADDNFRDVPLPSVVPDESAAPEWVDIILQSEPLDFSPSPLRHADPEGMFSDVTRGLIRVERRKVFRRRLKWYAIGVAFPAVVAAVAYAVWHDQPDWMLQWMSTDWMPDFLSQRW